MRLAHYWGIALAAACVAPAASAQQAGPAKPASNAAPTAVTLPPAPTAPVGSGDSTARVARAKQYVTRGEAALAAGMRDTAKVAWEKALYEDAACTDASVDLARVLTEDGDGLHARELLMRALARDPSNPKLLHFKARRRGAPPDSTD